MDIINVCTSIMFQYLLQCMSCGMPSNVTLPSFVFRLSISIFSFISECYDVFVKDFRLDLILSCCPSSVSAMT